VLDQTRELEQSVSMFDDRLVGLWNWVFLFLPHGIICLYLAFTGTDWTWLLGNSKDFQQQAGARPQLAELWLYQ
jgi:hypothetical protein